MYILYVLHIKREQCYTYTFPNTISFFAKWKIASVLHAGVHQQRAAGRKDLYLAAGKVCFVTRFLQGIA